MYLDKSSITKEKVTYDTNHVLDLIYEIKRIWYCMSNSFLSFWANEDNIEEALSNNVPFINIDKLKDDIIIRNVNIHKDYNKISIEFDGICDFFCAMVTFKYDDDFRISEFHAS